jgi:hypothetical protein
MRINQDGKGGIGNQIMLGQVFFKDIIFFGSSKCIIEKTYSIRVVGVLKTLCLSNVNPSASDLALSSGKQCQGKFALIAPSTHK